MQILHVTIQTDKFLEEIAFYEKYIGLTIHTDLRPMGRNIVFLSNGEGETEIEIVEDMNGTDVGNPYLSIGFQTENLEEFRTLLENDGFNPTEIIRPNPNTAFFFAKDPAGAMVQFM